MLAISPPEENIALRRVHIVYMTSTIMLLRICRYVPAPAAGMLDLQLAITNTEDFCARFAAICMRACIRCQPRRNITITARAPYLFLLESFHAHCDESVYRFRRHIGRYARGYAEAGIVRIKIATLYALFFIPLLPLSSINAEYA